MTDPIPQLPALQLLNMEGSMFDKLSEFQQSAAHLKPVAPSLVQVLSAALPAFELGFSYTASHWNGELTVTLHYQGAELGSSATASIDNYGDACARLLAGLLGIPLLEGEAASEPEPEEDLVVREAAEPVVEEAQEADDTDEEFGDESTAAAAPQPNTPDTQRELTEEEKATAIGMIKVMEPAQRKAFTKAFRELFNVPAEAKVISPYILRLEHWLFIDRYTVEASGGVAA